MVYTPRKLAYTPKIAMFARRYIFQTIILGIHLKLLWVYLFFQAWVIHGQHVNFVHCWWMMSLSETRFSEIYININTVYRRSNSKYKVNMYYISGCVSSKQAVIGNVFLGILGGMNGSTNQSMDHAKTLRIKKFSQAEMLELQLMGI